MIKLLKKLFIKNYNNIEENNVRIRYGIVAGTFGIVSNLILFILKIFIGIFAKSITIIADAINNLSDTGSSAITVFGYKMSAKPADPEHPFGHARYEYVSALLIAVIVMFIGAMLAKESIEKIIHPTPVSVNLYVYLILVFAILVKLIQMFVYRNFSKAISSDTLRAASIDSRNDIISTFTVLVAVVLIQFFPDVKFSIDGVMGLLVSAFIIFSSIILIKDTITPLLGTKPDKELVAQIKNKLLSYEGVLGIHDLMVHSYGVGVIFAVVHIEVCSKTDIMISHDLMDNIERDFKEELGIDLSIHMDPIETDNPYVDTLKEKVENALSIFDSRLRIHDFRIVTGKTHTNILFDAEVPYGLELSSKDIENLCREKVNIEQKCFYIINIDIKYDV